MADVALVTSREVCAVPWLVRKLTLTGGTGAAALAHGGPAVVPDLVIPVNAAAGAVPSAISAYDYTTTTVTFDCLVDNAGAIDVHVIWFDNGAGGGIG